MSFLEIAVCLTARDTIRAGLFEVNPSRPGAEALGQPAALGEFPPENLGRNSAAAGRR